jgi:dGTP triphosphohydrolase
MKTKFFHNKPKKKSTTFQQLLKAKKEGYTEGVTGTVENYSAVVLLCLKDKFGFTSKQLQDVAWHINDTFDSVEKGYLSLEDIIQTLKEEDDLDLRFINK